MRGREEAAAYRDAVLPRLILIEEGEEGERRREEQGKRENSFTSSTSMFPAALCQQPATEIKTRREDEEEREERERERERERGRETASEE